MIERPKGEKVFREYSILNYWFFISCIVLFSSLLNNHAFFYGSIGGIAVYLSAIIIEREKESANNIYYKSLILAFGISNIFLIWNIIYISNISQWKKLTIIIIEIIILTLIGTYIKSKKCK